MNCAIHPAKAGKGTAVLALAMALSTVFAAENKKSASPAATPNPQQPMPNPAAEQALKNHFQAIFLALEGQAAIPDAKNFTEEFNKQASTEQLKQVFAQVHQTVGNCHIAGQIRSPISYIGSYLLQCDKAFIPMDVAVEERAPYRVHSLLIRPSYNKP